MVSVLVAAGSNPKTIAGPVNTTNLPDNGPAPALAAKGWINSPPLTPADLTGKVVLYDFWTYSCINCVRTFPYIRPWYDRYRADGLVIIGVHSPEFDFEKVHSNVQAAVKRLDVTWPVALDDDMTIWNVFKNKYWPADYIADRDGHIRYTHFGEGDYDNTENVMRTLLGVPPSSPRAEKVSKAETASGQAVNPETYLGFRTVRSQRCRIAGSHDYPARRHRRAVDGQSRSCRGRGALVGVDGLRREVTSAGRGATIVLGVHANRVNLVLATATATPMDAIVSSTAGPYPWPIGARHPRRRHRSDRRDRHAPDMYRLVLAPGVEDHLLNVIATPPGLEAYDFTFG